MRIVSIIIIKSKSICLEREDIGYMNVCSMHAKSIKKYNTDSEKEEREREILNNFGKYNLQNKKRNPTRIQIIRC